VTPKDPKPNFEVYFWANDGGKKPVAEWMKKLPLKDRLYLGGLLRDLAFDGPSSRPNSFKHLDGALWEIRDLRKGPGFRIYFGFDGESICIVVNSGNKSSQSRDIVLAKDRLKEIEV